MAVSIDGLIEAAGWWSYAVVFAATAAETSVFIGLLVPGETVILLAAALAGRGDLNVLALAVAVVAGGITGDNLGFALGRRCARRTGARRSRGPRWGRRSGRSQAFLVRHGGAALFTGRFVGFLRTFLPYAAGVSGMPFRRFFLYSTAASLVWGVGNVVLGYFAGAAALEFLHTAGPVGAAVLATVVVTVCVVARIRGRHSIPLAPSTVVASGRATQPADRAPVRAFTHSQE